MTALTKNYTTMQGTDAPSTIDDTNQTQISEIEADMTIIETDLTAVQSDKANKTNVLELDNSSAFTPDADYEPATKKYVDDNAGGNVDSVNGESGVVVLTTGDLVEDTDKKYCTDAEKTVIGNTSGANTGDQDISGIATNATDISGLQTALDGKIDDSQVLTDVPAGAVFTDTVKFEDGTDPLDAVYAGGNVGIGTTTPNAKLEVKYDGADTITPMIIDASGSSISNKSGFLLKLPGTGNRKGFQIMNGSDAMAWASFGWNTGGTDKPGLAIGPGASSSRDVNLYRDSANVLRTGDTFIVDGNVGIGTTAPEDSLHIGDGTGTEYLQINTANSLTQSGGIKFHEAIGSAGFAFVHNSDDNKLNITGGADSLANTWLTIQRSDGNVGIGEISPSEKLDVDGNIAVSGTVDGIDIGTDVAANTLKETNATHTGEVTGSGALTLDATAISNKTSDVALTGTEEILMNDGGLKKTTTQAIADLGGGGGEYEYIYLEDRLTTGVFGGGSVQQVWTKRNINTEVTDTGNNCTLASNQFTLAAGTYLIDANSMFLKCNSTRIRLQNMTDANTELAGMTFYSGSNDAINEVVTVRGLFTIAASKTFEIQYWAHRAQSSYGLGITDGSDGLQEVYTNIELTKIA